MWKRNLITRSVAIVPSLLVVLLVGPSGADDMIVWSQVLLSIQLPFALIPLLKMTRNQSVMGERFANGIPLQTLGWTIGLIIITANVTLVGFSLEEFLDLSTVLGKVLLTLLLVVGVVYISFLVYLSTVPVGNNSEPPVLPVSLDTLGDAFTSKPTQNYTLN
jgi:hypothetical protein